MKSAHVDHPQERTLSADQTLMVRAERLYACGKVTTEEFQALLGVKHWQARLLRAKVAKRLSIVARHADSERRRLSVAASLAQRACSDSRQGVDDEGTRYSKDVGSDIGRAQGLTYVGPDSNLFVPGYCQALPKRREWHRPPAPAAAQAAGV